MLFLPKQKLSGVLDKSQDYTQVQRINQDIAPTICTICPIYLQPLSGVGTAAIFSKESFVELVAEGKRYKVGFEVGGRGSLSISASQ